MSSALPDAGTEAIRRDIPDSLSTERLVIRVPRAGDGLALNRAVRDSWAELRPWMDWAVGEPPDVEASEVAVRRARARFISREDIWLFLFLKQNNELVGSSGLHRIDWSVPRFEIGYWVRTPYARRGLITEAVAGITGFAFATLGARRVEIRCDARNHRSVAVPNRLGFELEATLRHHARHHLSGALCDTLIFVRLDANGLDK